MSDNPAVIFAGVPYRLREISPFYATRWHGGVSALDHAPTTLPSEDDVAEVIAWESDGEEDDGYTAAILRLRDGRYMGWSTSWGPTGDGFHADAYGGNAVVYYAFDLDLLVWQGLDDMGRMLCGYPAHATY